MPDLKSYRSPKTEVREKSVIEGRGLFAKESIRQGEVIFIKAGHIVTVEEALKLEETLGEYSLQISDGFSLCPTTQKEVVDTAIYINHSCEPNVGPDGQITFIAIRDIEKGEEICYDYAMTTTHPYEMECNCGTKSCRKLITGEDWKRTDLQERYEENFSHFILKKIVSETR